jgi:hypothetical protein
MVGRGVKAKFPAAHAFNAAARPTVYELALTPPA